MKKVPSEGPYKMVGIHIPDWPEVREYFTVTDREHMYIESGGTIDLHDCQSVLANAQKIWDVVSKGVMPPGNPWPPGRINDFYSWWKGNGKCPS